MEQSIPLSVALDEVDGINGIAEAIRKDLRPRIVDNWPQIRVKLEAARVERVVELTDKLQTLHPGLVQRLDDWVGDREKRRKTSGVEPLIRSTGDDAKLLWDLMYWKYSIDHRGRGNGAPQALFEKVVWGASPLMVATFEPIGTDWDCPNCGHKGTVYSYALAQELDEYRHLLSFSCKSCGHTDYQYHRIEEACVLGCHCGLCARRRKELFVEWRQRCENVWEKAAADLVRRIRKAQKQVAARPQPRTPSADATAFARMLWEHPDNSVWATVSRWRSEKERATLVHPFHMSQAFWRIAPDLVEAGVLTCHSEPVVDLNDAHAVIERAFQSRANTWREEKGTDRKLAQALTDVMMGPRGEHSTMLMGWAKAANESGMVHGWLDVPCDFWFSINRDRLRELFASTTHERDAEGLYLYRCHTEWGGLQEKSARRLREIGERLRTAPLLGNDDSDVVESVRQQAAPAMAAKALRTLETEHPSVAAMLDDVVASVRSNASEIPALPKGTHLWEEGGKALGNYLYWSLCREAIGEKTGVPLAWIMRTFNCQAVQFRKLLERPDARVACPTCGGEATVSEIQLSPPQEIGTAVLNCSHCRHVEQVGKGGENQLVCQCARCTQMRREALAEAKSVGERIVARVLDGYLKKMDTPRKKGEFDWVDMGTEPKALMGYAQLRIAGYSVARSAAVLAPGSLFVGKHGFWSPVWMATFVKAGVFEEGDIERLDGVEARRFMEEEVLARVSEKTAEAKQVCPRRLADIENALCSEDARQFAIGLQWLAYMTGGEVALPMRRRCTEVPSKLRELAYEASRRGVDLETLNRESDRREKAIESGVFAVPAWSGTSRVVDEPVAPLRPEIEAAKRAALGSDAKSAAYVAGVNASCEEIEEGSFHVNPFATGTAEHDAFVAGREAVVKAWERIRQAEGPSERTGTWKDTTRRVS